MTYVVATTKRGSVRLVRPRRVGGGFTVLPALGKGDGDLPKGRAKAARDWAVRRGWRVSLRQKWPFIVKAWDTAWPCEKLCRKLNALGKRLHRQLYMTAGLRTPFKCWELRMAFLRGDGNLAARCCTKYTGYHSWDDCGKNPLSNHASGNAADMSVIARDGERIDVGRVKRARRLMHKLFLCLPVGVLGGASQDEPWHVEVGDVWNVSHYA